MEIGNLETWSDTEQHKIKLGHVVQQTRKSTVYAKPPRTIEPALFAAVLKNNGD